jgi:4,5-DOPA dioxygenase extradiol
MFALEPGRAGPALQALGAKLPQPKAIAVISPHWMTREAAVATTPAPATIHDFGGFDPRLRTMHYRAPGHPALAARALDLLRAAGWPAHEDPHWGLDHGTWVPLTYLYPMAEVPVFQISLPAHITLHQAWRYGEALRPLSAEGVLVIGSGSLTHNLGEFYGQPENTPPAPYARAFVDWVRHVVQTGDGAALRETFTQAPHAARAHPTEEHYLPLLVAMGAAGGQPGRLIDGGIVYGMLSMDSFVFGETAVTV